MTRLLVTFKDVTSFNGNISNWNVSSVSEFGAIFDGTTSLTNCMKRSIYHSWNTTLDMDTDYSSWASVSCTYCGANQYVSSNACVACAPGTTNDAGNDASGSNTTCVATLCAEDYYVSNHTCVACAAGTTNAADDDASGSDTACNVTYCAEDYYVSNHVCTICPAGTTNDAGDDASGSDTACNVTYCAGNQSVSAHVCVNCTAGKTNVAGDDASGSDTFCDDDSSDSDFPDYGIALITVGVVTLLAVVTITIICSVNSSAGKATAQGGKTGLEMRNSIA